MRSGARAILVVAMLTLAAHRSARAQDSTTATRDGWIVGPLIGQPGAGSEAYFGVVTLGVGVTRLVPNRPGVDFSIGTLPQAIPDGLFPIGARIGPSIPLAIGSNAFLIPSAGVSVLAVIPSDGGGVPVGWYWGAAAVVAQGSIGFRAGVTWHEMPNSEPPVWLVEVGVMHVPLPRLAH